MFDPGPYLEMRDVDDGIGIFRFVQGKGDGSGDGARHGHSCAGRKRCGIEKVPMHGDEAALRLCEVGAGMSGTVERELKDFNPGALLQSSGTENLAAEHD